MNAHRALAPRFGYFLKRLDGAPSDSAADGSKPGTTEGLKAIRPHEPTPGKFGISETPPLAAIIG
jgi:hypothetical protein